MEGMDGWSKGMQGRDEWMEGLHSTSHHYIAESQLSIPDTGTMHNVKYLATILIVNLKQCNGNIDEERQNDNITLILSNFIVLMKTPPSPLEYLCLCCVYIPLQADEIVG